MFPVMMMETREQIQEDMRLAYVKASIHKHILHQHSPHFIFFPCSCPTVNSLYICSGSVVYLSMYVMLIDL